MGPNAAAAPYNLKSSKSEKEGNPYPSDISSPRKEQNPISNHAITYIILIYLGSVSIRCFSKNSRRSLYVPVGISGFCSGLLKRFLIIVKIFILFFDFFTK